MTSKAHRSRLRLAFATASVAAAALASSVSVAERIPGSCFGFVHPGPTSFRCEFTHQGRHIFAYATAVNLSVGPNPTILGPLPTPNAVVALVDVFLARDPTVRVAECSFHGSNGGVVPPLFAGPCFGGGPNPVPEDGEALLCVARARTHALFGCTSTPDLDHL